MSAVYKDCKPRTSEIELLQPLTETATYIYTFISSMASVWILGSWYIFCYALIIYCECYIVDSFDGSEPSSGSSSVSMQCPVWYLGKGPKEDIKIFVRSVLCGHKYLNC